jgi:hypothetical protein
MFAPPSDMTEDIAQRPLSDPRGLIAAICWAYRFNETSALVSILARAVAFNGQGSTKSGASYAF